jgi:hypothetical protein
MKGLIATLVIVVVLAATVFFAWIGKSDNEVVLRENTISQMEVCSAKFDEMFKSIAQIAQVPTAMMETSKEAFKEIYQPLIEGRYQNKDGEQKDVLMSWVQESNPTFDMSASTELYSKVQTVIEVKRTEFFNEQKKLIAYHQAHTVFCSTFVNKNFFMMGDRLIDRCKGEVDADDEDYVFCVQIIKSANTDNTYRTGQENDISVF